MAEPEEFTLADETVAWLNVRKTYRLQQQGAYLGVDPEDINEPVEPGDDCELTHNNYFTLINPGMYQDQTSPAGWPPAQDIIDELFAKLASTDNRPAYNEIIRRQLQVNALESFRRTLLNRRQRKKHLLRHQQQTFLAEQQAQSELESLLQNVKVGQAALPPEPTS